MSRIDETTAHLLAERHFQEVNEWAINCLEAGFDSKHLRMLAASLSQDWPSVREDIMRKALAELGWDRIHRYEYMLAYARCLASDILERRVDAVAGSRRMYGLIYEADLSSELYAWYEIDEILWDREYSAKTG